MRGKEYGAMSDYIGYGITPAYAGKSHFSIYHTGDG